MQAIYDQTLSKGKLSPPAYSIDDLEYLPYCTMGSGIKHLFNQGKRESMDSANDLRLPFNGIPAKFTSHVRSKYSDATSVLFSCRLMCDVSSEMHLFSQLWRVLQASIDTL